MKFKRSKKPTVTHTIELTPAEWLALRSLFLGDPQIGQRQIAPIAGDPKNLLEVKVDSRYYEGY